MAAWLSGVGFIGFVLLLGQGLHDLLIVLQDEFGAETVVVVVRHFRLFLLQLSRDHQIV